MTDGVTLNPGAGGAVVDTEISPSTLRHLQRFKLVLGAADVDGGDVSASNAMPVAAVSVAAVKTPSAATNIVLKAAPGALYGFVCYPSDSPAYLMLFDALTAPADGTVQPKWFAPVSPVTGLIWSPPAPLLFATGIVAALSTTGPFVKTTGTPTMFFMGQVQ